MFVVKKRTVAHKSLVGCFQKPVLLGRKVFGAVFPNMFHALKQLLVQHNVIDG